MTLGFDKDLFVLPFDHRGSFQTKLFGWKGRLTLNQTAQIAATKQVIYDGFKAAVSAGVPKEKAGILVDEQFGAAILRDASEHGFMTACPAEKSAQNEFDFEYGDDFAEHIEAFHPTFCKVLVRYNPESDQALNQRQAARLRLLSDSLHSNSHSLLMFELLVPAEEAQLERLQGDAKAYDLELRPGLMVQAIRELQDAGVEADVWKIEGLDRREDCERIVAVAHRGGRDKVGSIVWAEAKTLKKFTSGLRRQRGPLASLDLPSAAPYFGRRLWIGGPRRLPGTLPWVRLRVAIGRLWTVLTRRAIGERTRPSRQAEGIRYAAY